jgi:nucleotide-binding universal stress UspA family protein
VRYFSTVLVAVDGSEASEAALEVACSIAKNYGGRVTACAVIEPHARLSGRHVSFATDSETERECLAVLTRATERAQADHGLTIGTTLAYGDPADSILAEADKNAADTIVLGTHGRQGFERLILGSVAESVARRSTLPVLLVRQTVIANQGGAQALPADASSTTPKP